MSSENAKLFIKISGIYIVKNLLKIFWLFPINSRRIMFCSYFGKSYSCNPKYIYQRMKEKENYQYIWVINDKTHLNPEINDCIIVHFKTIRFFYYILTSKVYINNGLAPSYIPFRKKQYVLGTWHGGGAYKKSGTDTEKSFLNQKLHKLVAQNVTGAIAACKDLEDIFQEAFCVPASKILKIGMPRNDLFFHQNTGLITKVKNELGIDADKKVVLYAPTFRSDLAGIEHNFHAGEYGVDYQKMLEALKKRFGGEWVILFRSHYYLELDVQDKTVINVSDYEDMQELLLVSDILINDYSSSMWDFGLQKRPCFIYASDLYEYEKTRGFYTPVSEWPFPVAVNNEELEKNILDFDEEDYLRRLKGHYESLGSYESGNARDSVAEIIRSFTGGEDD